MILNPINTTSKLKYKEQLIYITNIFLNVYKKHARYQCKNKFTWLKGLFTVVVNRKRRVHAVVTLKDLNKSLVVLLLPH